MTALLDKVFLAAYFSHSASWICHVCPFWPARSLLTVLLSALYFYSCRLRTSCLDLLSGFSLYLWNLQVSLLYVKALTYFLFFFIGVQLTNLQNNTQCHPVKCPPQCPSPTHPHPLPFHQLQEFCKNNSFQITQFPPLAGTLHAQMGRMLCL